MTIGHNSPPRECHFPGAIQESGNHYSTRHTVFLCQVYSQKSLHLIYISNQAWTPKQAGRTKTTNIFTGIKQCNSAAYILSFIPRANFIALVLIFIPLAAAVLNTTVSARVRRFLLPQNQGSQVTFPSRFSSRSRPGFHPVFRHRKRTQSELQTPGHVPHPAVVDWTWWCEDRRWCVAEDPRTWHWK